MTASRKPIMILMADDDPEVRMLAQEALEEARLANEMRFVEDGEQLMDYLHRRGPYANPVDSPRPGLILLDLNMPKKDGREALKEIKSEPTLRQIPVVVLTTSKAAEDLYRSYHLGANSRDQARDVRGAGGADEGSGAVLVRDREASRRTGEGLSVEYKDLHILLIDDDEDDYTLTRDLLSEIEGVNIDLDWIEQYDAALEAIERQEHDIYLVDYRLGQHDGLELLRVAVENGCKRPLILLTG